MANVRKLGWHRRSYISNTADPTEVIIWRLNLKWFEIKLVESWGLVSHLYFGRFQFNGYNSKWAVYLYNFLEDGFISKWREEYDHDVAQAERAAGWDPNP